MTFLDPRISCGRKSWRRDVTFYCSKALGYCVPITSNCLLTAAKIADYTIQGAAINFRDTSQPCLESGAIRQRLWDNRPTIYLAHLPRLLRQPSTGGRTGMAPRCFASHLGLRPLFRRLEEVRLRPHLHLLMAIVGDIATTIKKITCVRLRPSVPHLCTCKSSWSAFWPQISRLMTGGFYCGPQKSPLCRCPRHEKEPSEILPGRRHNKC